MKFLRSVVFFLACCFTTVIAKEERVTRQAEELLVPIARAAVRFLLWTRKNPLVPQLLFIDDPTRLAFSNYVKTLPTRIYVPGFQENPQNEAAARLRDRFVEREDSNFIIVDWLLLALPPNYAEAVKHCRPVGIVIGEFVQFLVAQGADLRGFHLIGFSLGGPVVAEAGRVTNGTIPRITGLEPSYPLFESASPDKYLDKDDAQFVDIIHTNGGKLQEGGMGFPFPTGHADFWINGGFFQPECVGKDTNFQPIDYLLNVHVGGYCSHMIVVDLFSESVKGAAPLIATRCDDYNNFKRGLCENNPKSEVGYSALPIASGNFFLDTPIVTNLFSLG